MKNYIAIISLGVLLISCKSYPTQDLSSYDNHPTDYSDLAHWAAHPDKVDPSDRTPGGDNQSTNPESSTDVFFLHPTTFTSYKGDLSWNADIHNTSLNEKTDNSTILYQASAFNVDGRVYAPRYRQAHIHAFYTEDRVEGDRALDVAYKDVKNAFDYYMEHDNKGRNIVIASHSQGTRHAAQLLKDYFDQRPLQDKLVAAYIIGLPVKNNEFNTIKPCSNADDTGCFISWRTFKTGYTPEDHSNDNISVINPLSWTTTNELATKDQNIGGVLRDFDKVIPHLVNAQVHQGILWVNKPKFPWSFLFTRKNYHIIDINLFYTNIRENVINRINEFTALSSD